MVIYPPHSPFLFSTDVIAVRWYGFLIALAILASYFISLREAKKSAIEESSFDGIFLSTVALGIIGARLGFVIQNTTYYFARPIEILYIFDGGLSIHGAIILGVIGLFVACRHYKVNFLKIANIIAPYILLSGAIGRWGNFFNQEIIGKPSSSFIKLFVDQSHRPAGFEQSSFFHPVFLYESILLLLAFVIYQIFKKKLKKLGLAYTVIIYSLIRIAVEFFRIDYKPILAGLDLAQLVSSVIIIFGLIIIIISRQSKKLKHED